MAIDRKAYINTLYKGEAQLPRDARQPGHVGLRAATCSRPDWDALPEPTQDVDEGARR